MRAIVVGAGEVGYHVADRLSSEKHDVVVIDLIPDRLEYVSSHLDVAVLEGNGASPAVLEKAGIREASLLLAVTSTDEVNLVCCMTMRDVRNMVRIARVSNPDFYGQRLHLEPEQFGVDVLINPERELALETIGLLQVTAAREVAVFAGGAVQLMGITVADDAPIAGRKLQEIGAEERHRSILTVGIERDGRTIVPGGATEVRAGDHLYVVTGAPDVRRAIELCGYERSTVRRVMVAGGSLEAFYVGELLAQHGVQMTMLVDDRERAQELAGRLDHALVLHGDATDVELLEMEGVGGADAFVALTDEDDTNILSSLVAKHAGAKQIITLVNKPAYVPLARRIGLDAAVSPRLSAANAILRYVRAGSVKRVATFSGHEGEAIAFAVGAQSPAVGRPLAEVNFPEGSIVAAVVRGRDVVVPRGDDVLQVGDTAIVFALPDAIREVTEIFPS